MTSSGLTYVGQSSAVCERCLVRCGNYYEDSTDGHRLRLVRCLLCGNGDPQLNTADHADFDLDIDSDTRFLLYMMSSED